MTLRSSVRAREKALDALTREAAGVSMPELDWERIEAKVLAGCAITPEPPKAVAVAGATVRWVPASPTWASSPWPVAMATAAAAALIYGTFSDAIRAPVPIDGGRAEVTEPHAPIAHRSALDVGEVVETGTHDAHFDATGVVSFALAPNTRIQVVGNDIERERAGGVTVALAHGSIHADVTSRTEGEVFAVEVERTRIAVHGTSFTVTREGDKVIVDVAHGSVAVGPTGYRGSTHGWLVVGPDRAAFSLDGAREATWLGAVPPETSLAAAEPALEPPPLVTDGRASRTKRPTVAANSTRVDGAAPAAKGERTAAATAPTVTAWGEGSNVEGRDPSEQEAAAVSSIVRQLGICYEKQASALGVRFFVESSLRLTLSPSGAIQQGVFTPPLSPTLMSCANKAIGAAHFPRGEAAREVRIPVQLSRAPR